jgi:Ser/Thr protein kinase RdoA (MazF antagonist)
MMPVHNHISDTFGKAFVAMRHEFSTTYIAAIAGQFITAGEFCAGKAFGSGHINDTYLLQFQTRTDIRRFILQRINTRIFKQPEKLMENILRVTRHQLKKMQDRGEEDTERKYLRFFPAKNGEYFHRDGGGNYWRVCQFIERAHTCDTVESAEQAFLTAASFARFQKTLVDLSGDQRLHETIPDFHHTASRFADFKRAVELDAVQRAVSCKEETDFVLQRKDIPPVLIELMKQNKVSEKITHNDTKISNIMLDDATNKAICIIDLDTVMPGSPLYDFGDMVRSSSCTAAEDEKDPNKVAINTHLFEAVASGYLSEAKDFLNSVEIDHLVFSGKLIAFEQGIRFLTDYLNGDIYYKIKYPEHNIVRARNQFKLVESVERQEKSLNALVKKIVAGQCRRSLS